MKTTFIPNIISVLLLCCACQTNVLTPETTQSTQRQKQEMSPVVLSFSSIQDFQNTLFKISNEIEQGGSPSFLKQQNPNFISYAETIMADENSTSALYSEVIGSILNPEGEVIIGDYILKLCDYGILYSFKDNVDILRKLSLSSISELNISKISNFPIYNDIDSEELDAMYEVPECGNVYFYDIYRILDSEIHASKQPILKVGWSEPSGVHFVTDYQAVGPFLESNYTIPNASDQKNKFSGGKVANDTKIYRRVVLGYKESGVKTKTMKKKGLVWQKFNCNNTSAITDLYIHELNWQAINHSGWLDINTTSYSGRSYVIATKVTDTPMNVNMSNEALINECNDAIAWAKSKGLNISNVDGVRHIYRYDTRNTKVRIKDKIVSEYSDKVNAFYNLEPVGTLSSTKSALGNLVINNMNYNVYKVSMYGYSEYESEKKGARVQYLRTR